jgi:hypothetical protein
MVLFSFYFSNRFDSKLCANRRGCDQASYFQQKVKIDLCRLSGLFEKRSHSELNQTVYVIA